MENIQFKMIMTMLWYLAILVTDNVLVMIIALANIAVYGIAILITLFFDD